MYAQHNVASVKDILGEHRIGHLSGLVTGLASNRCSQTVV